MLQSIWMVLRQINEGRCEIENQYARVVPDGGNARGADARSRGSTSCASSSSGAASARSTIRASGSATAYARFDAERKFAVPNVTHRRSEVLPVRRGAEGRHQAACSARCSAQPARRRRRSAR